VGEGEAGFPPSWEPDSPEPWDHDLSPRQSLNQLSHPGAPVFYFKFWCYLNTSAVYFKLNGTISFHTGHIAGVC